VRAVGIRQRHECSYAGSVIVGRYLKLSRVGVELATVRNGASKPVNIGVLRAHRSLSPLRGCRLAGRGCRLPWLLAIAEQELREVGLERATLSNGGQKSVNIDVFTSISLTRGSSWVSISGSWVSFTVAYATAEQELVRFGARADSTQNWMVSGAHVRSRVGVGAQHRKASESGQMGPSSVPNGT
jgi:hypothetical protein